MTTGTALPGSLTLAVVVKQGIKMEDQESGRTNQILETENARLLEELVQLRSQLSQYKAVSESLQQALKEKEGLLSQLMSANESLQTDIKCMRELCKNQASNSETMSQVMGMDINGHIPIQTVGEPEQFRKVFVGGLNYDTTEEALKSHFEQWGEVVHSVIMRDTSRKSRGFGFVVYKKALMVDEAQNNRPHIIDRRQVDTKRAVPKEDASNPESHMRIKKMFVGGLNHETEQDHLKDYFARFGRVENVEILVDRETKKKRGFAFVFFDDHDPVDKLVLMKHHVINGTRCEVKKAISKQEMKQRGPTPAQQAQMGPGMMNGPWNNGPNNTNNGMSYWNNGPNAPNGPNNNNNNNSGPNNSGPNGPMNGNGGMASNNGNPNNGNHNNGNPNNSNTDQQGGGGGGGSWNSFGANYGGSGGGGPIRGAPNHNQRSPGPYNSNSFGPVGSNPPAES